MPEWLAAVIPPAVAVATITFIGTIISIKANRKTAQETNQISHQSNHIDSLSKANYSWETLFETVSAQVADLKQENLRIRKDIKGIKEDLQETQGILSDSLVLNLEFLRWVDDGALPPPPGVKTDRLMRRLEQLQ